MKNQRLLLSAAILLLAAGGGFVFHDKSRGAGSACGTYRDDKTVQIGSHKLAAEAADTNSSRAQGLSGRPCIGSNQAMLFTFSQPGRYSFWMKDMRFPIDIIWISSVHEAVVVEENVLPSTYPDSFVNPPGKPAQYVLELKAHASTVLNINPGTPINF